MSRFTEILSQVHSKPCFEAYEATNVRNNTNCYSHALGIISPYPEFFCRIGAISGKKAINENYFSIEEIKKLLFFDCKALQLKIKESSIEEVPLKTNIKLYYLLKYGQMAKLEVVIFGGMKMVFGQKSGQVEEWMKYKTSKGKN